MDKDYFFNTYLKDVPDFAKKDYFDFKEYTPKLETFFEIKRNKIAKLNGTTPYKTISWKQLEKFPIYKMMRNHKFVVLNEGKWELIQRYEQAKGGGKRYVTLKRNKIEGIEKYQVREVLDKTLEDFGISKLEDIGEIKACSCKHHTGDFWGNWVENETIYTLNGKIF